MGVSEIRGTLFGVLIIRILEEQPLQGLYNLDIGGCQNYGPFLGPYYNTAPIISGKGAIILTTTHIGTRRGMLWLVIPQPFWPKP